MFEPVGQRWRLLGGAKGRAVLDVLALRKAVCASAGRLGCGWGFMRAGRAVA